MAGSLVDSETWTLLEKGKLAFERGEFGDALNLCESARLRHEKTIRGYLETLRVAMLSREVRKAGDDIGKVRAILVTRDENDVVAALDAVLLNHPAAEFGNSLDRLLDWLADCVAYPEADYMSGMIYETESEYSLALSYYRKAWLNRHLLDVADQRFPIAYHLADLSRRAGDFSAHEQYLMLIVQDDKLFGRPGEESPTLRSMVRSLRAETSPQKFFMLYRHSNKRALRAYHDLAVFYYFDSGKRVEPALDCAVMASCIALTALTEALPRYDFAYVYTDFSDALRRAAASPELLEWCEENQVWDSFLILGTILVENGNRETGSAILADLIANCPEAAVVREAKAILEP